MAVSSLVAASSGLSQKTIEYTTPGLSTFTLPSGYGVGNPLLAEVTILGGGGSAGNGFYNDTSTFGLGGGGGAGGILKKQLSLTANMNVYVGSGGVCYGTNTNAGGNGEFSYIGTGTPKNLFINPQFLGYAGSSAGSAMDTPFTGTSFSTSYAPAIRGTLIQPASWSSRSFWDGQTYKVKPSTTYTFSMHYRDAGGTASEYTLALRWFTEDGTAISTSTGSTYTSNTSTWTRGHVGDTSPSTAAYCTLRINRVSGSNGGYFSNAQFEEGVTSPSTYVDGDSSGYVWAGIKTGSVTLLASETMNIANGGGGGGGSGYNGVSGNSGMGLSGASSGGGGAKTTNSTQSWVGSGDGGGLSGNATHRILTSTLGTVNANSQTPRFFGYNRYAEFGFGTRTFEVNTSHDVNVFRGAGGPPNSDGYGRGGSGSIVNTTSSGFEELIFGDANNTTWVNNTRKLVDAKPNSGNGGSFLCIATQPSGGSVGSQGIAGKGGSGLVIIKYWS